MGTRGAGQIIFSPSSSLTPVLCVYLTQRRGVYIGLVKHRQAQYPLLVINNPKQPARTSTLEHLAGTRGPPLSCICGGDTHPLLSEADSMQSGTRGGSLSEQFMELETSLRIEVEFKLRGMLSIPPQFICDVVCFNRFSDDLMRAAYNPFWPSHHKHKNKHKRVHRLVGFPCGRNRVEGTSEKRKKKLDNLK